MTVQCFLVTPTSTSQHALRKYSRDSGCPGPFGYHNASVRLPGIFPYHWDDDRDRQLHAHPVYPDDDPRWPVKCDHCSYLFVPTDEWQVRESEIYADANGREFQLGDPVVGMMWEMPWMASPRRHDPTRERHPASYLSVHYYRDWASRRPPICVATPGKRNAQWVVDSKSSNGDGWIVTGDAPNITCSPSIVVDGYHGWLKDGVFSDPV